jgi:sporulation-control protein
VGLKRLLASMGAGGASVETVLQSPSVHPGGSVQGRVHVTGGQVEQEIEGVFVTLVARVEVESGDSEHSTNMEFQRKSLTGRFVLQPGAPVNADFTMEVPWETPVTVIGGHPLRGMMIGVGTDVEIARAVDKGDLDPIAVHPLPVQDRLLAALSNLGFRLQRADLERGHIPGTAQRLPFFQEIEFWPAPQYSSGMNQLEVTFIAGPSAVEVVLEVDRRGGLLTEGRDVFNRFSMPYVGFEQVDWEGQLHDLLAQMSRRRGIL